MGVIDKAAVVAMLEEWRSKIQMGVISIPLHGRQRADAAYEYELLGRVKDVIGILEVKEVENTELLKVRGYLVRDKDDYTAIYAEKPHRGKTEWVDSNVSCLMTINDARLVPDIEFEDEPVEVEVIIKTKKGE